MNTRTLLAAVSLLIASCGAALATDYTWAGNNNDNWLDTTKWGGSSFPKDTGDGAIITGATTTINIGVNGAVTCGVIRMLSGVSGVYVINGTAGGSSTTIYMHVSSGNAIITNRKETTTGNSHEIRSGVTIHLLSDLDISHARYILLLSCDFAGDKTINAYRWPSSITQNLRFNTRSDGNSSDSPDFSGTLRIKGTGLPVLFEATGTLVPYHFTNAAANMVVEPNGIFQASYGVDGRIYPAVRVENTGRLQTSGAVTFTFDKAVTVVGSNVYTLSGSAATFPTAWDFSSAFTGTGIVAIITNIPVRLTGSLSPGLPASDAGRLDMYENESSTLSLGQSAGDLVLNIDVTSSGGVGGVDHDQVNLVNMGAPVNLGNIDLVVTNTQTGLQTNWFLTADNGVTGTFNSKSISSGIGAGVYQIEYEANRVGIWFIPEPAVLGTLGVLALLRRRSR
jgi:hypothetical protein